MRRMELEVVNKKPCLLNLPKHLLGCILKVPKCMRRDCALLKDEDGIGVTAIIDLPNNLIEAILKRVTILDCLPLRRVCRLWNEIICSSSFFKDFPFQGSWICSSLAADDFPFLNLVFWNLEMRRHISLKIPTGHMFPRTCEIILMDSDKGVICLYQNQKGDHLGGSISVLNPPATRSWCKLPRLPEYFGDCPHLKVLKMTVDVKKDGERIRTSFKVYLQVKLRTWADFGVLLVYDSARRSWHETDIRFPFVREGAFSVPLMGRDGSYTRFSPETSTILPMTSGFLCVFVGEKLLIFKVQEENRFVFMHRIGTEQLLTMHQPTDPGQLIFRTEISQIYKFEEKVFFFKMRIYHYPDCDPATPFFNAGIWRFDEKEMTWNVESMMPAKSTLDQHGSS